MQLLRPYTGFCFLKLDSTASPDGAPDDEAAMPPAFRELDAAAALADTLDEIPGPDSPRAEPVKAVYVKNVQDLIVRELQDLRDKSLRLFNACIAERQLVKLCLQIDGTSLPRFNGTTLKIEQGVCKLILPGVASPQQSPSMSIPLFLLQGAQPASPVGKPVC